MNLILADHDARQAWLDTKHGVDEVLTVCGALLTERPAKPEFKRVKGVIEGPELLVALASPRWASCRGSEPPVPSA